jgi:hypothetical protein
MTGSLNCTLTYLLALYRFSLGINREHTKEGAPKAGLIETKRAA